MKGGFFPDGHGGGFYPGDELDGFYPDQTGGGFYPNRGGGGVSPLSIFGSNLQVWHRADSISGSDLSGSDIVTWRDQSGKGRNLTQGTSARRLSLVTNVINGRPVARPGTADDDRFMSWTPWAMASKGAMYAVIRMRTKASAYQYIVYAPGASFSGMLLGGDGVSDPANKPFLYTNSAIADGSTTLTDTTSYLIKWAWDDTTETGYTRINSLSETSEVSGVAFTAGNFNSLGIDPAVTATQDLFSDVGDLFVVSKLPTAAEDTLVRSYVTNFWGF